MEKENNGKIRKKGITGSKENLLNKRTGNVTATTQNTNKGYLYIPDINFLNPPKFLNKCS